MFAYCGNNPVNYCDPTGTTQQFWYKMFGDHDPGYIHRAVQVDILIKYNVYAEIYGAEYIMPGIGRADIVCLETGEMWEIKHGGSTEASWEVGIHNADARLDKYLFKGGILRKGAAGQFVGEFTIEFGSSDYLVSYETPQPGVILYTVIRMRNTNAKPDFVYVPHSLYEELYCIAIPLSLLGGVGAPCGEMQYHYYRGE